MVDRKNKIWKYCALALTLLALFLLQTTRAISPRILGCFLDLIPFFIAAVALFEGPYTAGCLGFAAGLLLGLCSPSPDGLLAIYYGLLGIALGVYGSIYMRPVLPSCLVLGFLGSFFRDLVAYVFYFALVYKASLLHYTTDFFISAAMSILPAILIYFWVRRLNRRFMEKNENEG